MEPNVGGTDRTVRVILGVLALLSSMAVVVYGGGLTGGLRAVVVAATLVFAAVMFATVGVRRCPVNAALGRNTCRGRRP
jgi:high-affinity Fe2+/Pb2+ permease